MKLKEGNVAAVADFGMARMKEDKEDVSMTTTGFGPLKWWPPEAIQEHRYSKKSDVFSYGVVLWEIETQSEPWAGMTAVAAAHKVLSGERLSIPENCTPILAKIMLMCWKEDLNERPDFDTILNILEEDKETNAIKMTTEVYTSYPEVSATSTYNIAVDYDAK